MATKTKKAKPRKGKTTSNGAKMKAQEKKIERLELLSEAQDLETASVQVQALKIKLQQLNTEATMTNRDLNKLQGDAQKKFDAYSVNLRAFKKKYNVPEDKEVNLRTGELVDPAPPQQGPPGMQEGPPPGPPTEPSADEAPQS
jgi:hypothetical protein